MAKNNFSILFYLNKSRQIKTGEYPIHLRISYNNSRKTISTGYNVLSERWDNNKSIVKGNKEDAKMINNYIHETRMKIQEIFNDMVRKKDIDLNLLIDTFFGRDITGVTLLELVQYHNEDFNKRIGIDFAHSTYEKYQILAKRLKEFIPYKYQRKDIRLKDLSILFVSDFEFYLKKQWGNDHNTAVKYIKNLKKILNIAVLNKWITENPFIGFKTSYTETNKVYLTEAEIKLIEDKNFSIKRLQVVKDLFLFQCFTGLSFTDLRGLTKKDVSNGIDGNKWIIIRRHKTNVRSTIPLLPQALIIIEKYKNFSDDDRLLPVYSNQKYNSYLEEIADFCGITKKITTHVGRRSFGNLALANGVSLNVIAKILGHSSTVITQKIYAVTNEQIVSKEMEILRSKLSK